MNKRWFLFWLCACMLPWQQVIAASSNGGLPTSRPISQAGTLSGHVFVKLNRLKRLLRKKKSHPFAGIIPLRATYKGRLNKGWLGIDATLLLTRPNKGRAKRFSIGGRGGAIFDVKINGVRHAPRRDSRGTVWISLPASSRRNFTVTYKYAMRVPSARGEHKLQLDLPQCTRAVLHMQFPGKGWEVRTMPISQLSQSEQKMGTLARLQLPSIENIWMFWKGKRIERMEKMRFRARGETLITLQEGLLQGQSQLYLEVLTGALRSIQLTLPKRVEVLHIGGKGVAEWFLAKNSSKTANLNRNTYIIQLSRSIRKTQQLTIRFEQSQKGKTILLPRIAVKRAEQWSGLIGVQARADTEVSHSDSVHAQQVDVRGLSSAIRQRSHRPILLAYREGLKPSVIRVKMIRHPQLKVLSSIINRASFETVRTRSGLEVLKTTYWVTNNRRQFLPIRLPEGSRLIGAFVAGHPIQPAKTTAAQTKAPPSQKNWGHYLLPLVRSSKQKSKREFAVELLSASQTKKLSKWGTFRALLPATPLQVLSYRWNYYLSSQYRPTWIEGSARTAWQKRFTTRLFHRFYEDLRAGTPLLWAGEWPRKSSPINIYNKLGLKERFAKRMDMNGPRYSKVSNKYKSKFAKAQWQVQAKMPLVGKHLVFFGHLVRNTAPYVDISYVQKDLSEFWYWLVLLITTLFGVLFLFSLFGPGPIRWHWIIGAIFVWMSLFALGFFVPLTYLAGFRGLLFGFWGALLCGLVTVPKENQYMSDGYLVFARWFALGLTFLLLLVGGLSTQIACLFLALPVYPALIRGQKKPKEEKKSPKKRVKLSQKAEQTEKEAIEQPQETEVKEGGEK